VTRGNFFEIFDAKSRVWGQFGPENKLIEGQPNEYDVICWSAVLAPKIFAGTVFQRVPAPLHPCLELVGNLSLNHTVTLAFQLRS